MLGMLWLKDDYEQPEFPIQSSIVLNAFPGKGRRGDGFMDGTNPSCHWVRSRAWTGCQSSTRLTCRVRQSFTPTFTPGPI